MSNCSKFQNDKTVKKYREQVRWKKIDESKWTEQPCYRREILMKLGLKLATCRRLQSSTVGNSKAGSLQQFINRVKDFTASIQPLNIWSMTSRDDFFFIHKVFDFNYQFALNSTFYS